MTRTVAFIIFLVATVIWFILRHPARRRAKKAAVQLSARSTREKILMAISFTGLGLIPLAYVITNLARTHYKFLGFADYPFQPLLAWLGTIVFAISLWLFRRTHKDLGRNWSVSLDIREKHSLVTQGVYATVRHPMYSAFWLWAIAQALLLPNWIAGLSGIVGFGTLFFGRVFEEERMLEKAFGAEYRDYMRRTWRVLPWVF
ncbi:MAG: protein-S-isoprenylcysteine O-methyltransferase [Pseudorhodoplanes sp.]